MPIYSTLWINKSVGRNGKNLPPDVSAVQTRLNALMHAPRVPLSPDGISGPKTRAMIRDFQRSVAGFRWPDGRVDPGGKTLSFLNDPASESVWAQMSIPVEPSGGGGGGGGGGSPKPKTPTSQAEAVDAAIAAIKAEASLSPSEEKNMRILLEQIWQVKRGAYKMTPLGISEEDLDDYVDLTKKVFHTVRISLIIASTHVAALGTAAIVGSVLGVILMVAGMCIALQRALSSQYRVYGALGMAHYIVWWAHGGAKPLKAQSIINNYEDYTGESADVARFQAAWNEGQLQAGTGLAKGIADLARQQGISYHDAQEVTKVMLQTQDKTALLKVLIEQLADGFHDVGDVQVANGLLAHSESRATKYPM